MRLKSWAYKDICLGSRINESLEKQLLYMLIAYWFCWAAYSITNILIMSVEYDWSPITKLIFSDIWMISVRQWCYPDLLWRSGTIRSCLTEIFCLLRFRGEWRSAGGHRLHTRTVSGDQQWGGPLRTFRPCHHPSCWQLRSCQHLPFPEHIHTPQRQHSRLKPDKDWSSSSDELVFINSLRRLNRRVPLMRKVCAMGAMFVSFYIYCVFVCFSLFFQDIIICECETFIRLVCLW